MELISIQTPVRQRTTTETGHLILQEFDRALVKAAIVWLQDSWFVSVDELHEAFLLNGRRLRDLLYDDDL